MYECLKGERQATRADLCMSVLWEHVVNPARADRANRATGSPGSSRGTTGPSLAVRARLDACEFRRGSGSDRTGRMKPRRMRVWARRCVAVLIGLSLLTGCARPTADPFTPPQKSLAECLELASEVAKHPPDHAKGRAAKDRYLAMCLDSR